MKTLPFASVLLLALPLAALAQTKPGPGDVTGTRPAQNSPATTTNANGEQQVVEVVEELDPATGRVIKRTTRTTTTPAAATTTEAAAEAPAVARPAPAARPTAAPATTSAPRTATTTAPRATPPRAAPAVPARPGTARRSAEDALVSDFLHEGVTLARVPASDLPRLYDLFIEKVRSDRRQWKPANWESAANVLSQLNARYEEVRQSLSFDDRLSIRADQGEFQTLRTARQVSDQVTNKL